MVSKTYSMPFEMMRAVSDRADDEDVSDAEIVRRAIAEYIDEVDHDPR
jgi:hypothetical protein